MTRGTVRRLGAAGLVLGCLIALPGQAGADPTQTLTVANVSANEDAGTLAFTVELSSGPDSATFDYSTAPGSAQAGADYATTAATGATVAGGGTLTIQVPLTADDRHAPDESFALNISNIAGAANTTATATGTILNDDAAPSLGIQVAAAAVNEGDPATFTLSMTGKSESEVKANYATANGDPPNGAQAGTDYTAQSGERTWAPGETGAKAPVAVQTTDDAIDEFDETFRANVSSAIGNAAATFAIKNTDPAPTVEEVIDPPDVTEADTTVNIRVRLSGPSGKDIAISYVPGEGGTATPDVDYVAPRGTLTIPAGTTELVHNIPVTIKQDTIFEGDETLFVTLTGHSNVGTGTDVQGKVTIKDDGDAAAAPTIPAKAVAEGNSGLTDLTFQVTLAGPRPATTFTVRTIPGTASASDFQSVGGAPLVFPASATATTLPFTIKVNGDPLDENDETFRLELLNPTTQVVVASAIGTITNDDNNSTLSISDATVDEPSTGTATLKFTVTLSDVSARDVSANWATADGTATAGVDYTPGGGVVSFAPGETSKTIDVVVIGDTLNEANETLRINLTSPTNAGVVDGQGDGTIADKNAPPSLSISDTLAREGEGATFVVTLAGTTVQTVTVGFNTSDGIAKAGTDYTARVGTLTFAPGEKTKSIAVTVLDDALSEPNEDFSVSLGDPVNGAITKSRGVASIEASDQLPAAPRPTPTPTPTPRPVAKPVAVLTPRMVLGPRTVTVGVNGLARMLVTCQKASPIGCAGTVELERAVKPLLKLGKKTFSVKKGTKGYASIKLTPRALAILRKNGTLRAKVVVLVKTSAKSLKVSPGVITLKGTKALRTSKPKPPAKPKEPTTRVIVDP